MKNKMIRRFNRFRVINRKIKLLRHVDWNCKHTGMLSKNKIHCSCKLCRVRYNRRKDVK